jgi:hypothetical protein
MTFVKPTVLPYAHLFDVDACAKYVSDYIFYQTEKKMKDKVDSPTLTLGENVESNNIYGLVFLC